MDGRARQPEAAAACKDVIEAWIEPQPWNGGVDVRPESEEWLAGRLYLDMNKLDASEADLLPLQATEDEEVTTMAA